MDSISQKSVCLIPGTHSERGVWPTERVLIFLPWSGCLWWCSFKRRHRIGENSRHRCLSAFQTLFSFFKRLLREILTFFYDYQHSLTIAMLTMLLASSQAFSESFLEILLPLECMHLLSCHSLCQHILVVPSCFTWSLRANSKLRKLPPTPRYIPVVRRLLVRIVPSVLILWYILPYYQQSSCEHQTSSNSSIPHRLLQITG